jgi:hypothetical protein
MKCIATIEWAIMLLVILIVVMWAIGRAKDGSMDQINERIVVSMLQREGYSDSIITVILQYPRLSNAIAIPDTLMQLGNTDATELIKAFGTRLRISDDGHWAGLCTLNKTEDSAGWHICMDVKPLYPRQ